MDKYDYYCAGMLDGTNDFKKSDVDWQTIAKNLYKIIQQGTKMPVHLGIQYIDDYLEATRE
jgi:hypothetical protein